MLDSQVVPSNSGLPEIFSRVKTSDRALTVVIGDEGGLVLDRALRKAANLSHNMLGTLSNEELKRLFAPEGLVSGANECTETSRFNTAKCKGPVKAIVSILREMSRCRRQEARRTLSSSLSIFLCSVEGGEPHFEPQLEHLYDDTDDLNTIAAPGGLLYLDGALPDVARMYDHARYVVSVRTSLTVRNKAEVHLRIFRCQLEATLYLAISSTQPFRLLLQLAASTAH